SVLTLFLSIACTYAQRVNMKNKVLSTSLRSEIQATDSTCNGCRPNNAATSALRQVAPVIFLSSANSSEVLARCSARFTRCKASGLGPQSWQSNISDSQVMGCQLPARVLVHA